MTADAAKKGAQKRHLFATTRWSLVLASAEADSGCEESSRALAELCRTYWRPVFAYVGRSGYNATDAQDLTQGFFLTILKGDLLQRADPKRGRFRTLLLHALKNYLLDGRAKATAKKRGGGVEFIPWDEVSDEYAHRSAANPHALDGCPADRLFDIRWAATVVEQAQWRLGEECERSGRRRLFDCVRGSLSAEAHGPSYAMLATQLGVPEITVKRLLHRLRQRYRELLREEVAQTVTRPEEIDDELRYLCSALAVEIEA